MNNGTNGASTQDPIEGQVQGAINCDPRVWQTVSELHRLASTGMMRGIAVVAVMRDGNIAKMIYLPSDGRLMKMVSGDLLSASVQVTLQADEMAQQRPVSPILRPPPIFGG